MNNTKKYSYLNELETESIFIIREAIYQFQKPVLLYSIGKDSSVLAHLLLKAFYPNKPTIPLLHIDTKWKFKEMIKFKNNFVKENKLKLITYTNTTILKKKINPFNLDNKEYTKIMKTDALKKALSLYGFDCAIGGARRDEEKSRAKERIFSYRDKNQRWDPKNQKPELWNIYNTHMNFGESVRVFPISNWSELDVWRYIEREKIKVVPLYFSKKRKIVERNNQIIMVDDHRFRLEKKEKIYRRNIRFRTLGCYPLTAGEYSNAKNIKQIIKEIRDNKFSERHGRLIDHDQIGSMEKKKVEGYF